MDLYKHAFRLTPLVPSELVADAFALAWDIRVLDMRAAPYDFTGLTLDPIGEPWTPVPIETPTARPSTSPCSGSSPSVGHRSGHD